MGTGWRTEALAGLTTFLSMAYIVFVNPSILQETGMPFTAVMAATCLSAAFGSILMGAFARYPIAMAPGMGLNAYFTFAVVKGMGVPWEVALGAVFISGVAFLILTASGIRQLILAAIPPELYAAVAVGIGFFIAFIGLRSGGIITASPATLVTLGDLREPGAVLAIFGLLLMASLMALRVRAALVIGVLTATLLGTVLGLVRWQPQLYGIGDLAATAFRLDPAGAIRLGFTEIIFVFLFVDLFDNLGTLLAVGKRAGILDSTRRIPRIDRIFVTDASATIVGSLTGTSTVVSYIESASGVVAGGRSGVTAIVVGLLFLLALPMAPIAGAIPAAATAPALILVGSMMVSHMKEIDWSDPVLAVPSFLIILTIPLSFSIANGLAFGFSAYTLLCLASGQPKRVNWLMYVLTALFIVRFIYLGQHG